MKIKNKTQEVLREILEANDELLAKEFHTKEKKIKENDKTK